MQRVLSKVFGTSNDRELKRIMPLVTRVNELEPAAVALPSRCPMHSSRPAQPTSASVSRTANRSTT